MTDHPADDHEPCFSPDGSRIAFRSEREGGGICVISALGGEAHLLVKGGRRPRYSPDGPRMALVSGSPDFHLFVTPVGGGEPWQTSSLLVRDYGDMVWSPDGNRLMISGFEVWAE